MIRMTEARLAKGWTKAELARRAGMSPSDVGRIENRRAQPYVSQRDKLARKLGLRPDELLEPVDGAPDAA